MKKWICDRCGGVIESAANRFFAYLKFIRLEEWKEGTSRDYDLCGKCYKEVKQFVEKKPKE